ncbi:MAG TPA: hypothetical protein VIJ94_11385 [Caulobacteraceae bacterium]
MSTKRPKFAAVMIQFRVKAGCSAGLVRHVVWDNNRGDPLDVDFRAHNRYGAETLPVRLSRGYVGNDAPVMVSRFDLRQITRAAQEHHDDVTSGMDEGIYDRTPEQEARMEVLKCALSRARAVVK